MALSLSAKQTVLLVGGSGFLGRNILEHLISLQFNVITPRTKDFLQQWDIHSSQDRIMLLERISPDVIINAGWCTSASDYRNSHQNFQWSKSTIEFYKESERYGAKKYISLGTFSETEGDIFSNETIDMSKYAQSKRATHSGLLALRHHINVELNWLRIGYPYGKYDKGSRLIPSLVSSKLAGLPSTLKNPNLILKPIYATDIANAVSSSVMQKLPETMNIYGQEEYRLEKIYSLIESIIEDTLNNNGKTITNQVNLGAGMSHTSFVQGIQNYIQWAIGERQ